MGLWKANYNIENNKEAVGTHFNLPGHALHHFSIQVIEKVVPESEFLRLKRESMWIRKLETKFPRGLNKKDWYTPTKPSY